MSGEWRPGDVAMLEVGCWANRRVGLHVGDGWRTQDGNVPNDPAIVTARPLVVFDPEDECVAEDIVKAFVEHGVWRVIPADVDDTKAHRREQVQAALRSLVASTPEEPTNPKALVTDRRDNVWRLLADGEWVCTSGADIGEYLVWSKLVERGPLEVSA